MNVRNDAVVAYDGVALTNCFHTQEILAGDEARRDIESGTAIVQEEMI